MSLDFSQEKLEQLIHQAAETISQWYSGMDERKVFPGVTPDDVRSAISEKLPEEGSDPVKVLEQAGKTVFKNSTLNIGPNFYGYITGGGNQVSIIAEALKAALNQNNLKWHSSPVSSEMEILVCRWIAEFIGYPTRAAGVLLGGGSVANFECLAVARKNRSPGDVSNEGLYNSPPMTVYVSEEGHSSFDKAVDMLGIGKKYLRKIPADDEFKIDTEDLERNIRKDIDRGLQPICAIAIAGTTNTGSVDDLDRVADIAQKYGLWYHIDAAYGGPAAALDRAKHLFNGIERADSVVVNPHKWMYVPFGASCVLVKDAESLRRTFSTIPDYLKSDKPGEERTDLMEYNLPLTKEFRSLKVWMTLKTYGAKAIRSAIDDNISVAGYLYELIDKADDFEVMAPAPLGIVCFRYVPRGMKAIDPDQLNDAVIEELERDGRVFLAGTKINGKSAIRVCIINHRTSTGDMDKLVGVIREAGKKVAASHSRP